MKEYMHENFVTKKEFDELKTKVDAIEKDVAILKQDMAEVKTKVNEIFEMLKFLLNKK